MHYRSIHEALFDPEAIAQPAHSLFIHENLKSLPRIVYSFSSVPFRPVRSEPRVRKRRPKIYPLMTKPRHELRKQLQTA
ncbi:hypothetical protein LC605_27655 [Nostoc sp. CHAB 5836]|uniref:hypothetical protein n=1 Tax=Nostoc sp. CHAB 5836 TaxID=2780404 RepID=UPI001E379059|nr:hypothetical protein [Nostoc sp. CHAB 5836]MCC5618796.1 hypothetical protein [Nostoc sp. CHAB 5836]